MEGAVPGGVSERDESSEFICAEYDADEYGVWDDYGAGRAAVVADGVTDFVLAEVAGTQRSRTHCHRKAE